MKYVPVESCVEHWRSTPYDELMELCCPYLGCGHDMPNETIPHDCPLPTLPDIEAMRGLLKEAVYYVREYHKECDNVNDDWLSRYDSLIGGKK